MNIASWYEELDRSLSNSDIALVRVLNEKYPQPWAIPFFGNLPEARVLTVGLNPSFSEFSGNRWWAVRTATEAANRLLNYFKISAPPHLWFSTWEAALNELDASYHGHNRYLAAHVDIWPRATDAISEFPKEELLECIGTELPCFLSALEKAHQVKLILMAGSVTKDFYLNHFLQTYLPKDEAELELSFNQYAQPGPGKTVFHRLRHGSRTVPVFFCSTSPSDDENRNVLVEKVAEYATPIKNWGKL